MPKKLYQPISAVCKDCGKDFVITSEEQKYFRSKGYVLPKRCLECRKIRKEARSAAEHEEREIWEAIEKEERQKRLEKDERELEQMLKIIPFPQTSVDKILLKDPVSTLVVIGNGFDLMHGVKSSYWEFQKTIGKKSPLRFYMETYLDTANLWSDLEDALGRLNYSMFLDPDILDLWLDSFGAYDPDAQTADFYAAVETAIAPTFEIPRELYRKLKKWVKTLSVESDNRPFAMLHGDYKVLSFNYTEFIESLYGAKPDHICYIHGCRRNRAGGKAGELVLGHKPGMEEEQWDKVKLKPVQLKDPYKRYMLEAALETAVREALWYEETTTKKSCDIINSHRQFFDGLRDMKEIYVIGHSLSEVDYPYFTEVSKKTSAKWFIGYHSLDDLKRLLTFIDRMELSEVSVFRT